MFFFFVVFFFFQAEDGIRDAQESRGLGDVYKRQGVGHGLDPYGMGSAERKRAYEDVGGFEIARGH